MMNNDQMTDRHDIQVEDGPKELKFESEHSCHDPSTFSPQFFFYLSAPEVVSQ